MKSLLTLTIFLTMAVFLTAAAAPIGGGVGMWRHADCVGDPIAGVEIDLGMEVPGAGRDDCPIRADGGRPPRRR